MLNFITDNWITITTAIGGSVAWFYERNKREQDIKASEIKIKATELENSDKIINMYQRALDDLGARFTLRIDSLEKDILLLNSEVSGWKKKYGDLKTEFNTYKKVMEK